MQALAWYNQLYELGQYYTQVALQYVRRLLGPEPARYLLLANGDTIPAHSEVPAPLLENAYEYDPTLRRFTRRGTPQEGRYRPLPYLGLIVRNPAIGEIDLSDWIGEARIRPVAAVPPAALVRIWATHHNRYIPTRDTLLEITDNEGTQKTEVFCGDTT
jgi:hypothetical protein